MPAISVIAGGRDITNGHDGLQLSNVDPGGFEVCQLHPHLLAGLRPGAPLWIRLGNEVMGHYRINEPGQHDKAGRSDFTIAALGYAAKLKDNPIRRLYVDRDLAHWSSSSVARKLSLVSAYDTSGAPNAIPDAATGQPSLQTQVSGDWVSRLALCEGLYQADGLPIASVYYAWKIGSTISSGDPNWSWVVQLGTDDTLASLDDSGNLRAAGPGSGTLVATTVRTAANVQLIYAAIPSTGHQSISYPVFWTCLAAYGSNPGMTKRGTNSAIDAQGYYTSDIVRDAVAGLGFDVLISEARDYVVAHAAYLQATTREQIIEDQAKLAGGWHWGVWEPRTTFSEVPVFLYQVPPDRATCIISRFECDELEAPKVRLDQLYDTAVVAYHGAAGGASITTVTIPNHLLIETGVGSRTLNLDAGIASQSAAQTFGRFALLLALRSARGGGWAMLPDTVMIPGGGRKPACLLRAGRDRIRINDLPDSGPATESESRRYDTFLVRRVEATIDQNGVPRTRVEFDGGADLLEVLQARLAIAQLLAGA